MTDDASDAGPDDFDRVVAVDLGSRRIGVAVSDGRRKLAFPRPFIERTHDRARDHGEIASVVEEVGAAVLVVGLPLSLDGSHGAAARAAADEAQQLAAFLGERGVAVDTFDERFTTAAAHGALAAAGRRSATRRGSVDSAAATILLQSWLEAR